MFRLHVVLVLGLSLVGLRAQADALAAREQKLVTKAVAGLHAVADGMTAQRQHGKALALRRELLLEYADEDQKAREKCGYTRVGDVWRRDSAKLVLEKDFAGEAKVVRKLEQELAALRKELLAEHRAIAEAATAAGDAVRGQRHWQRVLRLQPGDAKAVAALAVRHFDAFPGTADELTMLRRARAIRGAVDWLQRATFPAQALDAATHPLLALAGLAHGGVRTEHFEVWGTLPPAQLQLVAQHVEKALLLCHTLLGTHEATAFRPQLMRDLLFVADDASYHKVLDLCADQFPAERLQFLKTAVDLSFVNVGEKQVRLVKTNGGDAEALDQAVRGVVQDAIGLTCDGLWEGLGHAACGFVFGRTLTFLLEQQTARTVASWETRLLEPDFAVWREIAQQSAWSKSDTRTSELVLISAARFSTEQRVKAWAICDYLLHWRPELLRELDRSRTEEIRTPPDIEREFLRRTGFELPRLDFEWRQFWAKADALRQAMARDPLGDPKAPDRAQREQCRTIVDAVNAARAAARRGPLGFFVADDADTKAALQFAEACAKYEAELKKEPKQPPKAPVPPTAVGNTVLLSRRATAPEAVADWMCRPAWRDALLHPGRALLGSQKGKVGLAVDLIEAVQPARGGLPLAWPRDRQSDVPAQASVESLGPRAAASQAGKAPADAVGMPLTLHFARVVTAPLLEQVRAALYHDGRRIDGLHVVYEGGAGEDAAAGVVAFVPAAPLAAGAYEIEWRLPAELAVGDANLVAAAFTVR
jgi:hypothetical protein